MPRKIEVNGSQEKKKESEIKILNLIFDIGKYNGLITYSFFFFSLTPTEMSIVHEKLS